MAVAIHRQAAPVGGVPTQQRLGQLRALRTKLETEHALHPSRTTAVQLAAVYQSMADVMLASAGVER